MRCIGDPRQLSRRREEQAKQRGGCSSSVRGRTRPWRCGHVSLLDVSCVVLSGPCWNRLRMSAQSLFEHFWLSFLLVIVAGFPELATDLVGLGIFSTSFHRSRMSCHFSGRIQRLTPFSPQWPSRCRALLGRSVPRSRIPQPHHMDLGFPRDIVDHPELARATPPPSRVFTFVKAMRRGRCLRPGNRHEAEEEPDR